MATKKKKPHAPVALPSEAAGYKELQLYRGKLKNFSNQDCTFDTSDINPDLKLVQREGQILSVLSALVGNSGAAAGEAIRSRESNEVEAHDIDFRLDEGSPFFYGKMGFAPYLEGDEVEVVASPGLKEHMRKVFAIRRVSDGLITTMPTCHQGRWGYWVDMFRTWAIFMAFIAFLMTAAMFIDEGGVDSSGVIFFGKCLFYAGIALGLLTFGMCTGYATNSPQTIIAEHIFTAFGWKKPRTIILRGPRRYKKIIASLPMDERFKARSCRSDYNYNVFVYPRR